MKTVGRKFRPEQPGIRRPTYFRLVKNPVLRSLPPRPEITIETLRSAFRDLVAMAARVRSQQVESDPHHYNNLRTEIRKAFERAPEGRNVVCLGFGAGNDYSPDLFAPKFLKKFPTITLVDGSRDLVFSGLSKMLEPDRLEAALRTGSIQIVETDLSAINPHYLLGPLRRAVATGSIDAALEELIDSLSAKEEMGVPRILPDRSFKRLERGRKVGLLVSSTLFPDCIGYLLPILEWTVRQRIQRLDQEVDPRTFSFPLDLRLGNAIHSLAGEVCRLHVGLHHRLVDPGGYLLFGAHTAVLRPQQMLQNLGAQMDRLAFHYRNLALGVENAGARAVADSLHFHATIMQFAGLEFGGFGPQAHLGMSLRDPRYQWTKGFEVCDANAWVYHNNPHVDQATLVQSLLLKKPK